MATHRISILGANTTPDSSGDVFFEPYPIKATNDFWNYLVAVFNDTATKNGLHGSFAVPQNYVGSASLVIVWTATATTGVVVWDVDYRAIGGNDTESLDQATAQESASSNDTAPSAVHERMEISVALTDGNFAAGDTVQFILSRDGVSASDTMAAAAIVHQVLFEYADA
jgi:hypothetical protein